MPQVQDPLRPLLCNSEQGMHFSVPQPPLPKPPHQDSVRTKQADICRVFSTWKGAQKGGCRGWASLSPGEAPCWLVLLQTIPSWPLMGRLQEGLSKLNKQPCWHQGESWELQGGGPRELEVGLRSRTVRCD